MTISGLYAIVLRNLIFIYLPSLCAIVSRTLKFQFQIDILDRRMFLSFLARVICIIRELVNLVPRFASPTLRVPSGREKETKVQGSQDDI